MATIDFSIFESTLPIPSVESEPSRTNNEVEESLAQVPEASDYESHDPESLAPQGLHRVHSVRLREGVSLRTAARHTGVDIRKLRLQEQESTDLRISDLRRWQKALDVPMSELLEEPTTELSQPVQERAQMIRLMKTAAAIREKAESPQMERLAEMLCSQLTDIMPELEDVSPWHTFGQRRSLDELGAVAQRCISDDALRASCDRD